MQGILLSEWISIYRHIIIIYFYNYSIFIYLQAIECSLYGIRPLDDQNWDNNINRAFTEFQYEPNTNFFRDMLAKVFFTDKAGTTADHKYCVCLHDIYSNEIFINKTLVDSGLGQSIENEDLNFEYTLPKIKESSDADIEEDWDSMYT